MSDTDTSAEAVDWAALRRLAEAATPDGEWWDAPTLAVDCGMENHHAAYIAAAHPAAVLALLDQRDVVLAALHQARIYIEADETAHGRIFGDGNAVRAAIAKAEKRTA